MNNEQRIVKLETQIKELLQWKTERMRQQITFPLDKTSKDIITRDIPVWNGVIAENGVDYAGAMCSFNGRVLAVQVADPSIYE